MSAFSELHDALVAEQAHRSERGVMEWITAERDVMHAKVNRLRADRGKTPVAESEIRRAEDAASGHSDYTKKFALYCAGIVEAGR